MLIHRESLELAKLAPDAEDVGQAALTGIEIKPDGHVAVCDGHMWLRVSGKVDEPSLFDAIIPVEEREHESTIVLPAEAALSFNAALKKRKKKKGEAPPHVVISQEGDQIKIASSDGKVTRRFEVAKVEDPYPNIDSVFKNHATTKRVTFGVDLLLAFLKTVRACGGNSIEMEFAESELAPVRVSSYSLTVGKIDGALMPQRPAEKEAAA